MVYPARAKAICRVLDGPALPGVDAFLLKSIVKVHAGALIHAARSLRAGDIIKFCHTVSMQSYQMPVRCMS